MAAKELIMMDESNEEIDEIKNIAVVLSDTCMLNGNILTIPLDEALGIIANIAIQAAMLV